jgi:hypothetical protein
MYTLHGKPDQHATHIPHSVCESPLTIRISHGPHIPTFRESSTGSDGCTASEKKNAPDTTSKPGWVASWTCLSFSPNTTIEVVCLSQEPVDGRLLGLLGPYHQHAISTFHTCSWGPNHRSWTDTGEGYNLGGVGLPYHTVRPSQPMILHFPPKGPARSQVNQSTITNWSKVGNKP